MSLPSPVAEPLSVSMEYLRATLFALADDRSVSRQKSVTLITGLVVNRSFPFDDVGCCCFRVLFIGLAPFLGELIYVLVVLGLLFPSRYTF